jgi:hypothetical protein
LYIKNYSLHYMFRLYLFSYHQVTWDCLWKLLCSYEYLFLVWSMRVHEVTTSLCCAVLLYAVVSPIHCSLDFVLLFLNCPGHSLWE